MRTIIFISQDAKLQEKQVKTEKIVPLKTVDFCGLFTVKDMLLFDLI